jgi:hypothetical protein
MTEWKLTRSRDGLTKLSDQIGFISWKDDDTFDELIIGIDGIKIGRSLILGPFTNEYVWQTTVINTVQFGVDGSLTIDTLNSIYTLERQD